MSISWGDLAKQAGDVSFDAIPDGNYDFLVEKAEAKTTSTNKTMFKLTLRIEGGAYHNRKFWDQLVVTADNPNAMAMFFRKMHALGLSKDFFMANPSNAQIEQALTGRRGRAQLGQRTWQGNKQNEVKQYYVDPTGAAAPAAGASAPPPPPAAAPAPPVAAPAPPVAAPAPPVAAPAPVAPAPAPAPVYVPAPAPAPAPVAPPAPAPTFEAPAAPPAPPAPVAPPAPPAPAPVFEAPAPAPAPVPVAVPAPVPAPAPVDDIPAVPPAPPSPF